MSRVIVIVVGLAGIALAVGCAAKPRTVVPMGTKVAAAPAPATKPTGKADLAIDDIEPRAVLVKREPATRPSRAPLDALDLFAEAREAMLRGNRYTAVN